MRRDLFSEEHELFRAAFRQFVEREVRPHQERWNREGIVDREAWAKAGAAGFLCPWLDEDLGGPGGDLLHSVVVMEELARVYESGFAISLHSDICAPYIHRFGSDGQRRRWLPACASGERVLSLAMTEPGAGSDVAGFRTSAVRDGDSYVVNGQKTFISNGILTDLCIACVRTGDDPRRGLSLLVVEGGTPGFVKGKKLEKMGMMSQDTAEVFFEDCRVPCENLLGEEGAGFRMLMENLQQERLVVAVAAQAQAEQVLADTIAYTKERQAFGRPIAQFQNTRFQLADCAAKVEVGRAFIDKLLQQHLAGEHLVKECSIAKLWQTEMLGQVTDACLQLFGGYGYMLEYPVTRAFMDARVQRIFAGTNEIMKVIIAKELGL